MTDLRNVPKLNSKIAQVKTVKRIFNNMVDEYDHLTDLWYRYTFDNIDRVLLNEFKFSSRKTKNKPIALDLGCGTGIQSFRLASLGYKVIGVDISDGLIKIAKMKLFRAGYHDSEFYISDAQSLPFNDNIADCVNCCGPSLSFIPNWRKALWEISRCLKPSGKLLLEVEGKWNLDLFWEITGAIGFNFLKYDETLSVAFGHLIPPWDIGHTINYSFILESGEPVSMPLKLFTPEEINGELGKVRLIQDKRWGLHVITNTIPSTMLHNSYPSKRLKIIFDKLAWLEQHVYNHFPFNSFGSSILILAHKGEHNISKVLGKNEFRNDDSD